MDFEDVINIDANSILFMRPCDISPHMGRKLEYAEDGTIFLLQMYGRTLYDLTFNIRCDQVVKTDIESFYDSVIADLSLWTIAHPEDGNTYSLYFLERPSFSRVPNLKWLNGVVYDVEIKARGYRG